jgi:hypothetical protein
MCLLRLLVILQVLQFLIPGAAAQQGQQPFPDIPFKTFSEFIEAQFGSTISLSTVLMILLSMTENVTLLSLHGRQQKAAFEGEKASTTSGWIRILARQVMNKMATSDMDAFKVYEQSDNTDQLLIVLCLKLNGLAKLLKLVQYNKKGKFRGKLKTVSHSEIQPAHVICPDAVVCETETCNPRSLIQWTRLRDIPTVTLIKDFTVFNDVPVLTGFCPTCETIYHADHERRPSHGKHERIYLNLARYIKIGQTLWVDRLFTNAVLSGIYNFHASAATYAAFWNSIFVEYLGNLTARVTQRQIWQAFVQESV